MEKIMMHTGSRWLTVLALGVALIVGAAALAQATQEALDTQLATATQHAEFSMNADEHAAAVRHLGHVLNCIAGEGGEGFDGAWGHPCDGQGDGIMTDVAAHPQSADVMLVVEAAHALAMQGVQAESLGAVQAAAAGVRALLMVVADFGG
jgi:hypothetical protein